MGEASLRDGSAEGSAPRLAPVVYSTDGIEPAGRFETWRDRFRDVNDIAVAREAVADFTAQSALWRLGPLLLSDNRTPARRMVRTAAHCAHDDLDHWMLRVCRTGRIAIRDGGTAGPGELVLGSLADGYDYAWSGGAWVGVILPRDAWPALSARLERLPQGRIAGAGAGMLAAHLLGLADGLAHRPAQDAAPLADGVRTMISAALLRGDGAEDAPGASAAPMRRRQAERAIRAHLGAARLDARLICAETGMSRSALYRLFEADGGVAAHIQRLRLALVRRDLADPALAREPIWRIAERRGLFCVPSFNRAFRRTFDQTPGELRRCAQAASRAHGGGGAALGTLSSLIRATGAAA